MVRTSARSRFAVACTAVALSSTACFDTSNSATSGTYPTILTVDPALFRGTLRCGAPGLVHYVATLTDITEFEVLPSSAPTSCENFVSFGEPNPEQPDARGIKIDHLYIGVIEGYDRRVAVPKGAEGSRTMVDPDTEEPVAPRWTTTCGQPISELPDAGSDAEADSSAFGSIEEDAGEEDARTDAPPRFNTLRLPTQAIWKKEVILRGCYPLSSTLGPDASVGDADTDAGTPNDAAPPPDASIDHESPDGVTPDDGGDGATPDPEDGASEG